jgi:RimJ/RimL family protein N-acetyltransferase
MRLETERLILRHWRDEDRPIYAGYCADPQTRRYYPDLLTAEQTNANIDRYIASLAADGFGYLAVERKDNGAFLGDVGLSRVGEDLRLMLPGQPAVEMGWYLGREHWGQGFAPEAARAWLAYAFGSLALPEVVAFTATTNRPSQRVMEKIGMRRDLGADFEHPLVPAGHRLRPHLLYRTINPAAPR